MGVVAGFFGGWVDAVISRLMDMFLAFPLLVFAIALAGVFPDQAFGLRGNTLRIVLLIFIIGFFNWPYIGRIVRGQTLSLRQREFVDAARSLGARRPYILFTELLPNLVAPILVYSTLLIPTNILFEAALSFLGVGVRPPTPTWGGMLSDAVTFYTQPALHALARTGDLRHRAGLQSVRGRAARRTRPPDAVADRRTTRTTTPQRRGVTQMRNTRWRAFGALAAVAALTLSACGGGESGDGDDGGSDSGAAVTPEFNAALDEVYNPSEKKGGTIKFGDPSDWDTRRPG